MLYIAVCDDDIPVVRNICRMISSYCKCRGLRYKIFPYYNGQDILMEERQYQLVFLGMNMKSGTGIETAKKIRISDGETAIVLMSDCEAHWKQAFGVHAFQFIQKPCQEDVIQKVLEDYFSMVYIGKILILADDGIRMLDFDEIYYFEVIKEKKKVLVHTLSRCYIVNENLARIYGRLKGTQFYMTHRCCILNLKYVQRIEHEYCIVMMNGDRLPLAQKKKVEFLKKIEDVYVMTLKGKLM